MLKTGEGLERVKSLGLAAWAWVGIIIILSVALFVLFSIRTVLMPFLYALFLVYILRPVVDFLDDKGLPRVVGLLFSYVTVVALLTLFGMYVGPILYDEGNGLVKKFPHYVANLNVSLNDFVDSHRFLKGSQVTKLLTELEGSLRTFAKDIALAVPTMTASIFEGLLSFVLAPIIAFYILKDLGPIRATARDMIPERHRAEGMHLMREIDMIVGGFMKGQFMVALSVGVLSGIALSLLGIDYAILLGFLIGLFNIIPYLGPIVGGAPAVIIALGTSWQLAVAVIFVLIIVHQFDSIVISPRIMSQHVNLHPVVVIFSLLVGGTLFGLIGMLIAIPIAAVGKALYLHFRDRNHEVGFVEPGINELKAARKPAAIQKS